MCALSKLKFQPALPGEFTKRGFYNGKLDLTEIEGLADLIHAETEQQRRQALLQADGCLSNLYNNWRKNLSKYLAHIEAYIDFGEDDNIEDNVLVNCNLAICALVNNITKHLADGRRGEILRNGVRVVIIGQPNVGKSSLLNYLVQRNAAIVTPIAGTTRDIVELNTNISGYPIILADTAGLAEITDDIVEQEGIRRARVYALNADFIILMIDATIYLSSGKTFENYIKSYIETLEMQNLLLKKDQILTYKCIIVVNKIDLIDEKNIKIIKDYCAVPISCAEENGLTELIEALTQKFQFMYVLLKLLIMKSYITRFNSLIIFIYFFFRCGNPSRENPTISQARHRIHLTNCINYLENYLTMSNYKDYDMVIAAQQIRNAMRELGKITGHVSTEEILDIIFTNFCIGK